MNAWGYKAYMEDSPKKFKLQSKSKRKVELSDNSIETIEAILLACFIVLFAIGLYFWGVEMAVNAGIDLGEVWERVTN